MAFCIVVSGPPCAGKSTLAHALAARYRCGLLAKDAYKDALFGRYGAGDRDWSRRVSLLAWELLLAEAARRIVRGEDCVLEGNFRAAQSEVLGVLATAPGARLLEVRCRALPAVLLARYRARAVDGSRHPGHVDLEALPEIERELAAPPPAVLRLGPVVACDTSEGIDVAAIAAAIEAALSFVPPR